MFTHAGYRPLWPVIFFLPWIGLGIAYLAEVLVHRGPRAAATQRTDSVVSAKNRVVRPVRPSRDH